MASPYDNLRFSQSQIIPQYAGAPIEEFGKLLEKREADYNQNQDTLDLISSSLADTKVLGQDQSIKQEAIDKVRATINQITNQGGAYEFAGTQVKSLTRGILGDEKLRFANDLYVENKNLENQYNEMRANGSLDEAGYKLAMASLKEDHKGVGEKNEFGAYDRPTYYNPIGKIDIDGEILRRVSAVKAKQSTSGWSIDDKYKGALTEWTIEEIKEKEIQDAIEGVLGQGDNRAYLDQRAKYNERRGSGATTSDEIIQEYQNSYRSSAGVFKSKESLKLIPGTDLTTGKKLVKTEKIEVKPNTFINSGIAMTTENINAEELSNATNNRERMASIPDEKTKTSDNIAKATYERDKAETELTRLTKEAEQAGEALDPEVVSKLKNTMQDSQSTINRNEEKENLLDSEYFKLNLFHEEALKHAGLTEAQLTDLTQEEEENARINAGISWDRDNDERGVNLLGKPFEITPEMQLEKDKYIENNYPSYSNSAPHQRYKEAMEAVTGKYAVDMPIYGFTDVKGADEFTGVFLNSLGIEYNGTSKAVKLPFAEGENFPFEFKNYGGNMEDFDKDDYANMSTITVMGTTLRDGNMALVMGIKGKDGTQRYATFSDEAYTNNLLNKNPELVPVFEGLKATTEARANLNSPIQVKPENLGVNLIVQLPYTNPELLGAKPIMEQIQIIPTITASLDPEINSYLYTITFSGKVLNSDSERFGQTVDITEKLGEINPRFKYTSQLNQNKVIQYLEAYKNSAN